MLAAEAFTPGDFMSRNAFTALALAFALTSAAATAQELKIALAAEPSAIDPHFHNLTPNNQLRMQIFEALTGLDETYAVTPLLAQSWKAVDDTTWEFKLRPNVAFTDGAPFTANDVIYSICRVPTVENSPSSFVVNTKAIAAMTSPDPMTLVIRTDAAYPLLPVELSTIGILSARANGVTGPIAFDRKGCANAAPWPKTEAFNSGAAAIGTGPYKLAQYTKGDRVVLARNDAWWGGKPEWSRVILRFVTGDAPRVAALLAGDVEFIERPPIQDLERIKSGGFGVVQALSSRIMYLHFDYLADVPAGVTGTDGKNPFRDRRVRLAISKAIDRNAIVARIMGGVAMAAGEMLAPGFGGANKDAKPEAVDIEGAKKLLAEAGYPNGFGMVLGASNDRYINDGMIAQAVAQMLSRIGIKTTVDAMTASQFFAKRNKRDFGVWQAGWGSDTGEMSSPLKALVGTPNKDKGFGTTNPGGYSNPAVDALTEKALATVDTPAREALLAQATKLAMQDVALVPLHFEVTPWAFKKGVTYKARADQYTLVTGITAAK